MNLRELSKVCIVFFKRFGGEYAWI